MMSESDFRLDFSCSACRNPACSKGGFIIYKGPGGKPPGPFFVACQQDERIGKESIVKRFLPGRARGVICAFLIFCNTVFWMFPLFITGFLKFVIPIPASRTWFSKAVTLVCAAWNGCNNLIFKFMLNVQ